MHKHYLLRVVLAAAISTVSIFIVSRATAQGSLPWISQPILVQKQSDTTAVPSSLNGNIDCYMEDFVNCSVPTTHGSATQNSSVRLNGTPGFNPVFSYIENRQRFLPIPNSNTAITYTTEPVYGFYLYFNYSFSSSITKTGSSISLTPTEYHVNRPPDGRLADRANHRLAADYASMSFSRNGQWMVVSDPNVAMLRVNLQTFEVVPFAQGFNYTIGLDPAVKTAITNDGRYVVVASKEFNTFKLYDLTTCSTTPDIISEPVNCQSRDLAGVMKQQYPTYDSVNQARFLNEDTFSMYANYSSAGVSKTARFILSTNGTINQLDYLALGDSYISGEGAFDYQGGTDTAANECHLSHLAYPSLIGRDLNYNSYHSVACSGAVTNDVIGIDVQTSEKGSQAKGKKDISYDDEIYSSFLPGYRSQANFVTQYQPKTITISIGGNDMGFTHIMQSCADSIGACYSNYEDRLELVNQINNVVLPRLIQTYQTVKSVSPPDTKIYIIGYPQIAKPGGDCALNVRLNSDEVVFSQQLINYLDSVIKTAAAKTGVYYVDTQDAFEGHRLCEAQPGSVAINGLTGGNNLPGVLGGPIGNESYHPNPLGYELLENKILAATHNLNDPMPAPMLSATLPSLVNLDLLNAPHSGRTIKTIEYEPDLIDDAIYKAVPSSVSINGADHSLVPNSTLQAELHSDPISLGTYRVDANGNLSAQVTIPANTPAGYHSLHFYGTDLTGQPVDIYKIIYVAATADDIDGDNIADSTQACVGITASGQDYDKDSIDDACDGNITLPPAQNPKPAELSGSITSTTSTLLVGSNGQNQSPKVLIQNSSLDSAATTPTTAQTAVLGANTIAKPILPPAPKDNLRIPSRYLAGTGFAIFSLSSLAYLAKAKLF